MKFLFSGCSYCAGAELKKPETSRYSRIVSEHFKAKEINVAKNGHSNHAIIYDAYDALQKEKDITHVFLGITHMERFMIPGRKNFMQLNPMAINSGVFDMLLRMIYSSAKDEVRWFEYYRVMFDMFEFYCVSNNIKTIYSSVSQKNIKLLEKFNTIPISFNSVRDKHPMGVKRHPLEDAHKEFGNLMCNFVENKFALQ